jgi:hypothetical protein
MSAELKNKLYENFGRTHVYETFRDILLRLDYWGETGLQGDNVWLTDLATMKLITQERTSRGQLPTYVNRLTPEGKSLARKIQEENPDYHPITSPMGKKSN